MSEETYKTGFSFLEPYGRTLTKSKFERYWDRFKGPFSLHWKRVPQYSVYSNMTHFPLRYTMRSFDLDSNLPTNGWVLENLRDFIRTEFAEKNNLTSNFPDPWPIKVDEVIKVPNQFLDKFLVSSEWQNRLKIKLPNKDSSSGIAQCLYDLLCNPMIGSSRNRQNNDSQEFIQLITPTIEEKSRLLFVIPGFPFKDQNRFRVPFSGDMPDIGEISFMIRLFNLTQAMYQVHPYGVDVVVLSDGELYRDIFGVSDETISSYKNYLIAYRKYLNIQGGLSFICLKELINRSSDKSIAWDIVCFIKECIKKILKSDDREIIELFQVLISGMKWNLDTRTYLKELNDEVCWNLMRSPVCAIDKKYRSLWYDVENKAHGAALEYASINLMLRWTRLIYKFFPSAIRGTVHPKPGQFALFGTGGSFAWNGVATSRRWPKNIDDIRIIPYMSLNKFPIVRQVIFQDSGLPLFYTASLQNLNIEAAKHVLPGAGWTFGDIHGRELIPSDIDNFVKLGLNDQNYSWERKIQSKEYFNGLFQFRISHYEKYNFGVHGIWLNSTFIGQCGLQVLREEQDEVECVIFLGKDYSNQGLGSKLLDYIIAQCNKAGMSRLYGVVRTDNQPAIRLLEKVNSRSEKTIKHFDQNGVLHCIDLRGE